MTPPLERSMNRASWPAATGPTPGHSQRPSPTGRIVGVRLPLGGAQPLMQRFADHLADRIHEDRWMTWIGPLPPEWRQVFRASPRLAGRTRVVAANGDRATARCFRRALSHGTSSLVLATIPGGLAIDTAELQRAARRGDATGIVIRWGRRH